MAKSSRSKWKKMHRRIQATEESGNVLKKMARLNGKIRLVAKGGISQVPMEEPERRFHFSKPQHTTGERLKLEPLTTNPYGLSDPDRPHAQSQNTECVEADAPVAGHAFTYDDQKRADAKAAAHVVAEVEDGDGPMELVIGMHDDEFLTSTALMPAAKSQLRIQSMVQRKGETAGDKKMKDGSARKRIVKGTGGKKKSN
eukprot:TRINITY_DN406_c0_g1_i5.p1 TRINITY_DN406_c0_g1~~TRINITY_DN406_c0_g1_i5.p1  ORF type:complete len:199 (+),score=65.73 TRINITY_DN406_c0_g1_i5:212-808(+)